MLSTTFKQQLKTFLELPYPKNAWIENKQDMRVYLRKSCRIINNKHLTSIEIANIAVLKPGKGKFRNLINFLKQEKTFNIIYVENVFNPLLDEILFRYGFTVTSSKTHDYYFLLNKEEN